MDSVSVSVASVLLFSLGVFCVSFVSRGRLWDFRTPDRLESAKTPTVTGNQIE